MIQHTHGLSTVVTNHHTNLFNQALNLESDSLPEEEHYDDIATSLNRDQQQSVVTLPLELVSQRLAHRNFRNLMVGSLHQTWNHHVLSPTIDPSA